MPHRCPVCGYPDLAQAPRTRAGGGSYEICPSCGFEFGVTDDDAGFTYARWRRAWIDGGMRWASKAKPAPPGWNPEVQLQSLKAKQSPSRPAKRRA